MSLYLTIAHMEQIEEVLDTLFWDTEAKAVLLAYDNGQFISHKGELAERDLAVLSALTAAQLSATLEVARLVGERSRFQVLQEGVNHSVYTLAVNEDLLLVIVFSNQIPLGLVRMVLRQTLEQLRQIAADARSAADEDEPEEDDEFARLLADELDDLFDM